MVILKVRRSPFAADGAASDFSGQPELNLEQQEVSDSISQEADRGIRPANNDAEYPSPPEEHPKKNW